MLVPFENELTPYNDRAEPPAELDELAHRVIGAAIEVHRVLGPGLPEDAYEAAMLLELRARGISAIRQHPVEILYRNVRVGRGRIDLLVEQKLAVEIKSVEALIPIHRAQLTTYLRIISQPLGLLINFNVPLLKEGIKRVILS